MKEFLKKDLTLKILSIVFAIFLWFAINPVQTEYYTVPLNVINEESLKANGLVLNSKNNLKPVVVSVRERGDVLDAIKDSDFEVTLDLSKVKSIDDRVVTLEAPLYLGRESISTSNIDIKPKTITLDLGKIEENPFEVQVETTGKLANGYEIISKTATPDTVSIEALDSVINNVGSVKVYIDVTGLNKTLTKQKECKVYNKKGEEMPELSKKFTVQVKIEVGKRVSIIPITEGSLSKDFVEGISTVKPDNVLITGTFDTISLINELKTEPVKIDDATQTFTSQVLLQLPEGVKVVRSTRQVDVTVEIIPLVEQTLDIPHENINILSKNTDANFAYEITGPVAIKLKGKIEDLAKVTVAELLASIDVDKLEEGMHNIPLKVILPKNITQVEEVLIPVKITKGV